MRQVSATIIFVTSWVSFVFLIDSCWKHDIEHRKLDKVQCGGTEFG
jgi:hypothetical protein